MLARDREAVDHRLVRRHNGARLLEQIRRHGPISRAALAKRSRLSAPTVWALVDDLLVRRGLVREVGIGESSGGRPPVMLDFNAEFGYLAGVDIGSRRVRFALSDLRGRVLRRGEGPTPGSRDAVIDFIRTGIRQLFVDSPRDCRKLLAIGAGAPGMTDVAEGRVLNAVNIPGWTDVPLRDLLRDTFGVPVTVDNDVNMAVLGEQWAGRAQGVSDVVYIALGAGVGAGILINGRLHRGCRWHAGEIGRMNLDFHQWQTDYGDQGFLESAVGANAIAQAGAVETTRVFEAAKQGDAEAARIVEQVALYLGTAVANITTVLDPALVVFGGGVSHVGEQLLEPIRKVVARIVPNVPDIQLTALGDDAALYGSLHSALELADIRLFESLGA